jgi:cbb3-type cytochrome oxidase subunit 3
MLRDIFHSIRGFEHFGMISMLLFVIFFILVLVYTFKMKKEDIDEYRRIPFNDTSHDQNIN